MATQALAAVGVEAVVEGLGKFGQSFSSMNNWMDKFSAKGSLLSRIFKPVNTVLGGFFESLKRIGEFVTAGIILRGLETITQAIRNMIAAIFDAAVAFQGLQIRLENFIATDIMQSGGANSMAEALQMAVEPAKDLFRWVQQIAIITPFESQDVADAFTMAKAWGFATDEAKALTQQVIDFTAGMGFQGQEMDRVIKALGQMKSLGRVAGQELLQLANAGVPVADIMNSIREELGLTTKEFEALRMKGGVSAEMFFEKWDEMVSTRFEGAGARMSRTITGVLGNVKDLIYGVLGFNVVKPVLDTVSGKFADMLEALTQGERFNVLLTFFDRIGTSLQKLGETILNKLFPSDPDEAAYGILSFLDKLTKTVSDTIDNLTSVIMGDMDVITFLDEFFLALSGGDEEGKIVGVWNTLKDVFATIQGVVTAFKEGGVAGLFEELRNIGVPLDILNFLGALWTSFERLRLFFEENGPNLKDSLTDVLDAILRAVGVTPTEDESLIEKVGNLIRELSIKLLEDGPGITENLGKIADAIADPEKGIVARFGQFVDWITENEDTVLKFMENVGLGMLAFYTFAKIFAIGASIFGISALGAGGAAIGFKGDMEESLGDKPFWKDLIWNLVNTMSFGLLNGIQNMIDSAKKLLGIESPSKVFIEIGKDIMEGLKQGLLAKAYQIGQTMVGIIQGLISAAQNALDSDSPSKVFKDIGADVMKGMQLGLEENMNLPAVSMKTAVNHLIQVANAPLQGMTTNNTTVTNNYSMNINTQAKAEPIISDFQMMQSMAGG